MKVMNKNRMNSSWQCDRGYIITIIYMVIIDSSKLIFVPSSENTNLPIINTPSILLK